MPDSKLSALTAVTTLAGDELVYVVDDPAGVPVDRKVTVTNLLAGATARELKVSPVVGGNALPVYPNGYKGNIDTNFATGTMRLQPFMVSSAVTLQEIWVQVTTAAAAGNSARLGVFAASATWAPTTVMVQATVLVDVTGRQRVVGLATALPPGRYFLATEVQAATGLRHFYGSTSVFGSSGSAIEPNASAYPIFGASKVYGAFTANPTLTVTASDHTYDLAVMVTAAA